MPLCVAAASGRCRISAISNAADKVSIMTAAIKNPDLVDEAAAKIGSANWCGDRREAGLRRRGVPRWGSSPMAAGTRRDRCGRVGRAGHERGAGDC